MKRKKYFKKSNKHAKITYNKKGGKKISLALFFRKCKKLFGMQVPTSAHAVLANKASHTTQTQPTGSCGCYQYVKSIIARQDGRHSPFGTAQFFFEKITKECSPELKTGISVAHACYLVRLAHFQRRPTTLHVFSRTFSREFRAEKTLFQGQI